VVAGPKGITNIHFDGHVPKLPESAQWPLPEAADQLKAYFAAERRSFELDLDLRGTPLQCAVWRRLLEIPYGKTATYGEIAAQVDEALYNADLEPYKRPRTVGTAIGRNPVPVVVPCHRVIGADGSLTGYYGGLERKRTLLALEGVEVGKKADPAEVKSQLALL
jgi:methylated-DNA-[protein]-cysteine S-methyltransferase